MWLNPTLFYRAKSIETTVAPMCHKFYRILSYFTKVFTLGVLFFKKQVFLKDLPRKCADA